MGKFIVVLMLTALCVHAEEEQPKNGPSSFIETMLCYVTPKPLDCLKEQTGRMLNHWEAKIEEKRQQLMVEADKEIKESEMSRGLSDDEKKEKPSEILNALEKGFSALANVISDEVDNFRGRNGRSLNKQQQTKQIDDDANDFNDDFSIYDVISKTEGEGNVTQDDEESRAKAMKGYKKKGSYGYDEDHEGFYGYNSGGYGKGKKGKKHKKGLMKMFFLGAILKSKVEMLLKVLSFHLQLKFFAIALINMIINLARFWIDLKKQPQKVVYVEHAQHQHHYEDHDDWGNSWKRNTAAQQEYSSGDFAHRLAYNSAYPSHTK